MKNSFNNSSLNIIPLVLYVNADVDKFIIYI